MIAVKIPHIKYKELSVSEPVSTTAVTIKAGAMVATGSMIADLTIFQDSGYLYLAIVGAFVSAFGVLHEIFKVENRDKKYLLSEIIVAIVKGIALGFLAIPFWYLVITEGVLITILKLDIEGVSNSLALIVSFGLSWFTVPIWDWMVDLMRKKGDKFGG